MSRPLEIARVASRSKRTVPVRLLLEATLKNFRRIKTPANIDGTSAPWYNVSDFGEKELYG